MEYGKLQKAEKRAEGQEVNLTGIPAQMKWDLEARSGLSLDDVRVHYHSDKPAGLGALAYTQGTQVHIGPGQEGHLRHELGHVVQQKLGLVRPNARIPGGPALNTEEALERQADLIGAGQTVLSAAMPPVQRYGAPVVQAAGHITLIPDADSGVEKVDLPDAKRPTIVFEAMGCTARECEAVYEQTKRYKGNTICVFGLNAKPSVPEEVFNNTREALRAYAGGYDQGDDRYHHLLYTFSFRWTAIEGDTRGYEMPFVEARALVMQKAAGVVENLTKGVDTSAAPTQYTFLYRWIDADARDDAAASLNVSLLNEFAKSGSAEVMTGRYDWRSLGAAGSKKYYEAFLNEFNQAEKELRRYYMRLARRKRTPLAAINSRGYLPGYYFPESALMMNQAAHDRILTVTPPAARDQTTFLQSVGVSPTGAQDKESMRMVSLLGAPRIYYQTKLSVTKPLKNEFEDGSYWRSDMLNFLRMQDEVDFIVALRNVRQSAFDPNHWYFKADSEWNQWERPRMPKAADDQETMQELFNQKRRELANHLFKYLTKNVTITVGGTTERTTTRRRMIASEIPPPPAQS